MPDSKQDQAMKDALMKGWAKTIKDAQVFNSCGDVIKLDLTSDEKFGEIEIFLDYLVVYRILEYAFEKIPTKTPYHQKCLASIKGILLNHPKIPMVIRPLLNKEVLKICEAYDV